MLSKDQCQILVECIQEKIAELEKLNGVVSNLVVSNLNLMYENIITELNRGNGSNNTWTPPPSFEKPTPASKWEEIKAKQLQDKINKTKTILIVENPEPRQCFAPTNAKELPKESSPSSPKMIDFRSHHKGEFSALVIKFGTPLVSFTCEKMYELLVADKTFPKEVIADKLYKCLANGLSRGIFEKEGRYPDPVIWKVKK